MEIFGHLQEFSEILGKCSGGILHGGENIWILCSSGRNNISRVSAVLSPPQRLKGVFSDGVDPLSNVSAGTELQSYIRLCACGTLRTADWYNERLNLCGGERVQRTSGILFLPREHEVHIFELTCNVLFII